MFNRNRSKQAAHQPRKNQPIAIAGALRTGTNYVRFLLEQNYCVDTDQTAFGWKHGGIPIPSAQQASSFCQTPIVYVIKHPLAFVYSLFRYNELRQKKDYLISLNAAMRWEDFMKTPIELFDSQLAGSPRMRFNNPMQYWNFIYWNLETLDRKKFKIVGLNYEELLENPEKIRAVESVANLTKRHEDLKLPNRTLERAAESDSYKQLRTAKPESEFDASLYLEKRYEMAFTETQRQFVMHEADPWIMRQRGYLKDDGTNR